MNTTTTSAEVEKLGTFPFVLAGISFIPLIGVPFGFATLIWGLFTKKEGGRRLAIIGACGIATTVVVYGALFYFGFHQRGGIYDDLRAKLAQSSINSLVPSIELGVTRKSRPSGEAKRSFRPYFPGREPLHACIASR